MAQPLVIAYHLIWTAYGWWLPNDPRGSTSRSVNSDVLKELGEVHYGRKKVQPPGREVRAFQNAAKHLLAHDLLPLDDRAIQTVAQAFEDTIREEGYTCYACAIMPDHVHILLRKHRQTIEMMADALQIKSRSRLIGEGHRWPEHPVWSDGTGWKVFLDEPDDVWRTITYIERNPLPLRKPVQRWPFVTPYNGWPLHPGQSPNSPYARALKAAGKYKVRDAAKPQAGGER